MNAKLQLHLEVLSDEQGAFPPVPDLAAALCEAAAKTGLVCVATDPDSDVTFVAWPGANPATLVDAWEAVDAGELDADTLEARPVGVA